MKSEKRNVGPQNLESMVEAFLSKGGTITRCPPGPSETVVYKNSYRGRPKAAPAVDGAASPAKRVARPEPVKVDDE